MEFKYLIDPNFKYEKGKPIDNHLNIELRLAAVLGFSIKESNMGGRTTKNIKIKNIDDTSRMKFILLKFLPSLLKFPLE